MITPMISHVSLVKSPVFCWSRPYCPSLLCRQVQRLMEKLDDNASLTGQCVFAGAVPAEMGGPCLKWGNFTLAMAIEVYFHGENDDKIDKMIKHPSVIAMLLGKMINHGIWRIPVSRQTHAFSVTCALNESMGPISCNFPTILRAGFELTYSNKQMYRDLADLGIGVDTTGM